jgi:hypothetical protein
MNDANNIFSANQALTATAASTNVLKVPKGRVLGGDLYLVVSCRTALDSSGEAATLTITLQGHDDESFGAQTTILTSKTIAEASLTTGSLVWVTKFPVDELEGYVRLYYTVGTENFTSGNIDAYLTMSPPLSA